MAVRASSHLPVQFGFLLWSVRRPVEFALVISAESELENHRRLPQNPEQYISVPNTLHNAVSEAPNC
jgi:hypothetical protein